MQTPLDRFHNALVNLAAQKAQQPKPKPKRQPDRMAVGFVGERVIYKPGVPNSNTPSGLHGVIIGMDRDRVEVRFDNDYEGTAHIVHFVRERPLPTFTNPEDVDQWLAS